MSYFQLHDYNFTTPGSIVLPRNLSQLSDCIHVYSPLNRKGLVCSECADGFGPSGTQNGYKCGTFKNLIHTILLSSSKSYTFHKLHENRLYYGPNVNVQSYKNTPFIALSYVLAATFIFIPTILLCCYPFKYFKKKTVFYCCSSWQQTMDTFMDIFQGYYKGGTNETCDCRCLAGTYPLPLIVIIMSAFKNHSKNNQMAFCFIVSAIFSLVRPYKKITHNLVEILLLL